MSESQAFAEAVFHWFNNNPAASPQETFGVIFSLLSKAREAPELSGSTTDWRTVPLAKKAIKRECPWCGAANWPFNSKCDPARHPKVKWPKKL